MRCVRCSSYAINHGYHGRDGSDGDLCDVCYWRARAEHPNVSPARQPLTDEQIDAICVEQWDNGNGTMRKLARAIERAHGIGQEGGAA